jgi:pimeloyl-ACP methyl ester carboxylesterase
MAIREIDRRFLEDHASLHRDGVRRRTFWLDVEPGARCLSLALLPDRATGPGFVVCHSDGWGFTSLRRLEHDLARVLAESGRPVLTIHRRGFGDSTGDPADATLDRQVADIRAAAEWMRTETDDAPGMLGDGLGGLLAGLMAREGMVRELVLVNPVLRGRRYLPHVLKQFQAVRVAGSGMVEPPGTLIRRLRREGMIDVLGFPLYRELVNAVGMVDLAGDIGAFRGRALVMRTSRGRAVPRELLEFCRRVEGGGGTCRIELIPEPRGSAFGETPFVTTAEPGIRVDRQQPVRAEMAATLTDWLGR